jgi:hypothetical protein
MEGASALSQLVTLTRGLTPAARATAADLATVRDTLHRAASASSVEPVPLVFRRSLPAPGRANPALTPSATSRMASHSYGRAARALKSSKSNLCYKPNKRCRRNKRTRPRNDFKQTPTCKGY